MADDKAPLFGADGWPCTGLIFRRRRVFVKLREGFTYEEIAAEEGVSPSRIRQIVSEELKQREVDSGTEHAKLQLERLVPAIQLAAEGIAAGDVSAIMPYLRALDRLDRYQTVASANQVYDDEARKKLLAKINRVAEHLGIDENFAAAVRAHLKATGQIPADKPAEAKGRARSLPGRPSSWAKRARPRGLRRRISRVPDFFTPTGRNPLKRLDFYKINASKLESNY